MNVETLQLGGLTCRVAGGLSAEAVPQLAVVLCHGFGAPGTDLVPLGPELARLNPALGGSVRFVFPEAPLSLDAMGLYGGRAWWPLDVERITEAIERGELRDLRNDLPEGLVRSREMLTACVGELLERWGLSSSQIVLGGFSQGSMLATDVALRLAGRPAGLCIFSGTLLCEDEWRRLATQRGPMPVLQTHGYDDALLPFPAAEWLRDLLIEAGMRVEFRPFRGGHTIPAAGLERCAAFFGRVLGD